MKDAPCRKVTHNFRQEISTQMVTSTRSLLKQNVPFLRKSKDGPEGRIEHPVGNTKKQKRASIPHMHFII